MELLLVHSGGPSATLNAGLAGLVDACRDEGEPILIWGARHGAEGLFSGKWAELTDLAPAKLETVMRAPGSVLGTSRREVREQDAKGVVEQLARRGVDALIYAGGSASMAAAAMLAAAAAEARTGLRVIGLPNSANNDVTCTDHTPGFASAARFAALAVRDISEDNRTLPSPVAVIETIGRNAGWVAAAAALGRTAEDDGPHLIYLPEQAPQEEQIYEDVKDAVARWGRAVIVVSEGADPLSEGLARRIEAATGLGTLAERLGLLGRSCSWALSEIDVEESYRSGRAAAEAALGSATGVMIALKRQPGLVYRSFPHPVPFSEKPGRERKMPRELVGEPGEGGTADYLEWLRPLVGEILPVERIL